MKRKSDTSWSKARKAALERDRGRCIVARPGCAGWASSVHHINRRRGPDPHRLDMLASVCTTCHHWCHDQVSQAIAAGWLLRSEPVDRILYTRRDKAS